MWACAIPCPQHEYSNRNLPLTCCPSKALPHVEHKAGLHREVHRSFFGQCLVIDSSLGVCCSRICGAQPGQSCCPSLAQGLTQTRPQESQGARFCHPPLSKATSPSGNVRLPPAAEFLLTLSSQEWPKHIPDH